MNTSHTRGETEESPRTHARAPGFQLPTTAKCSEAQLTGGEEEICWEASKIEVGPESLLQMVRSH